MILVLLASPLLAYGLPPAALFWAQPRGWWRRSAGWLQRRQRLRR